ncbi:hypothetical protein FRC08_008564 [Ceratobasidium sp. 394]|nr:hypothetical protein FRC08_008564 [Ceratobasidium sp. 394]KAG9077242.1 hypothetical protein FS749_010882 [Ceratobasidium sp. UAMH 11750]
MGIDIATFDYLLASGFSATWAAHPVTRSDVNPNGNTQVGAQSLDAAGALGLLLHYLCSTQGEIGLQLIFALIPSTVSRYIRFTMPILLDVLRNLPAGKIYWPMRQEMEAFSLMIEARYPDLRGAFGFINGLNLPVAASSDPYVENANYNGWLHTHVVSNVIVFAPNGTILSCVVNAPGSWHDARVSQTVYDQLIDDTPDNFFVIGDTAFPALGEGPCQRIKTPLKRGACVPGDTPEERSEVIRMSGILTSARQAVEWGMRAIQGSFGRLRLPLDANNALWRGVILETCMRLHNVRTSQVGINQIRTVYLPIWTGGQADFFERLGAAIFPPRRQNDRVLAQYQLQND